MRESGLTVVRVYHAGGQPGHRARDRALVAAGARVVLVTPAGWPGNADSPPGGEPADLEVVEVAVRRAGDVNRHRYLDTGRLAALLRDVRPDILDVHEEPVSVAMRQLLAVAPAGLPVVGYTAQNLDKRFPPPYAQYERSALSRLAGLYPCSRQAASVAWGKGFRGHVRVLPLGYDPDLFRAGDQAARLGDPLLVLAGRLVPEKGVRDAIGALAKIRRQFPARLVLVGSGPEVEATHAEARAAGVADAVTYEPWLDPAALADLFRRAHIVLVPSRKTARWVEQFGRTVIEAQACGAVVCGYATGALPEVAGDAAALVGDGDVAALADRISTILTDGTDWMSRRALGLAAVRSCAWDAVAQRQLDFYAEVLRAPQHRRSAAPSGASRREARRVYGPPASVSSTVARSFAAPVLRDLGVAQIGIGAALDGVVAGGRWVAQRVRGANDR